MTTKLDQTFIPSTDDDTVVSSELNSELDYPLTSTDDAQNNIHNSTHTDPAQNVNVPRRRIRSRKNKRREMFEQHYKVDKEHRTLLPGVPTYDQDLARDLHDFFNLVVLVPIVVLNALNWDWESIFSNQSMANLGKDDDYVPFVHAWTGEYFTMFFWSTVAYFVADLLWVTVVPNCVKSPSTIIQHHLAVLLYVIIPYQLPKLRFIMGVCMSVEFNTWFLIARRVFNKQGFSPWTLDIPYFISVRVKLISIFFYITWISIRCILYPYVLYLLAFPLLASKSYSDEKHAIKIAVFLQFVFCVLNAQWSLQLFNSKLRQWRRNGETKVDSGL